MQLTFDNKTIDQLSIELIQAYEPPEGYYLGFSGGKDSVVIYDLAKRSGVKFQAYYNESPIDPPEIRQFIKANYPEVTFQNHAQGFFTKHFMSHGLPLRRRRWCCEIIKEQAGTGMVKILGMRLEESSKRSHYTCFMTGGRLGTILLPIVRWSKLDVWQYIGENSLKTCELYRQGYERIGCLFCPNASKDEIKISLQRYPNVVKAYKHACDRYIEVRKQRGTPLSFQTGEEYFNWWIKRD